MDTITLENALAGFTSNESSALSAYIGTNGKQSAAALAKVVGGQRTQLTGGVSVNTLRDTHRYYFITSEAVTDLPVNGYGLLDVDKQTPTSSNTAVYQTYVKNGTPIRIFKRFLPANETTAPWYEVTLSPV